MPTQDDINWKFTELLGKLTDHVASAIDALKRMLRVTESIQDRVKDLEARLTLVERRLKMYDDEMFQLDDRHIKLTARVHTLEASAGQEKEAANG